MESEKGGGGRHGEHVEVFEEERADTAGYDARYRGGALVEGGEWSENGGAMGETGLEFEDGLLNAAELGLVVCLIALSRMKADVGSNNGFRAQAASR